MSDKIGVLFLQAQEGFGADSAVHADIIRNLDRDRFDVHIACTKGENGQPPDSLSILQRIPDTRLRATRFAPSLGARDAIALWQGARAGLACSADFLALRQYVLRERIRIVHSSERPRDAVYNVVLAKLTRARSVVHVHVKWSEQYSKPAKWGVEQSDAVLSISEYVSKTLADMGKAPADIYTVLNGIETARWNPQIDGSDVRREFGISADALVLASVSRLFSWKGQRELVRAFALVRRDLPKLSLLIVGADAGEVQAGSFTEELRALARELGVERDVIFTGARNDVPRIMATCDLFTMPSFEEPFGLVFLEAMAMQKPVIALSNGGTPEVVEHGRTGLLSPAWDIQALAANIRTLLNDRELRVRMGELGRARVLELFTARRMAQNVAAAYEKILRSP